MVARAASLAFLAVGANGAFECTSDVKFQTMKAAEQKGLALDDTTFRWCPDQMATKWPNTDEPVKSVRIFKSWQPDWSASDKEKNWKHLVDYVKSLGAKALVGTQIGCYEPGDDADWADVKKLLQLLGPEHVMGVSIGNEVDLLWQYSYVSAECVTKMWQPEAGSNQTGGYLQRKFMERVKDLDALPGFSGADIPVTTVLSEYCFAGTPFVDNPKTALVNTFLTKIVASYKNRFVFSLNNYPYFDGANAQFSPTDAVTRDTCFRDEATSAGPCVFPDVTRNFRGRMTALGSGDNKLWIAETGWSSPAAKALPATIKNWTEFSSASAFRANYENFLNWDMTLNGTKGPDHVFYFTMRDAPDADGGLEGFGLIGDELGVQKLCQETKCKIQSSDIKTIV